MKNRLISLFLVLCLLAALPLSATYKYNPYTRKLDYYQPSIIPGGSTGGTPGDIIYFNGGIWSLLPKGANGEFLSLAAGIPAWAAIPAGITTFLGLADTPGAYAGKAGQLVRVNATPDALEFFAGSAAGTVIVADGAGGWTKDANFNIVAGKVSVGGYEGTAIANTYIAGIDQNLLVASSPTFNDLTISVPANIYALSHNSFADYVALEHLDWTADCGASNVNDANILASSVTQHEASINHNALLNYAANQHVVLPGTIANVLSDHNLGAHTAAIGGTGVNSSGWTDYVHVTGGTWAVDPTLAHVANGLEITGAGAATVSITHDATDGKVLSSTPSLILETTGEAATIEITGDLLPAADGGYDIGNNTFAWQDIVITSTGARYHGDTNVNGTWKIVRDGAKLAFQLREAGSYVEKGYFDATAHVQLPNTIANVLTDHDKATHDALLIDADTVDGEHAVAIVTNARVKAHFPDTIANILSDHNLAAHTALGLFDQSSDVDHNATTNYDINKHVSEDHITDHNLWLGYLAGEDLLAGGQYNTFIGEEAGANISSGDSNTFVGCRAGKFMTSAVDSVAVGKEALYVTTGGFNVAIGSEALWAALTGYGNIAIGNKAGRMATGADENILIGHRVAEDLTTGDSNIVIGYMAGEGWLDTENDLLVIENSNSATPLIYGEFDNDLIVINGTFDVVGASNLGDGGTTNYASFATDGTLSLSGTAKVDKCYIFTNAALGKGAVKPDEVIVGNYWGWSYDIDDDSVVTIKLPDDYASGTDVAIHIRWAINEAYATNSGEVRWQATWSAHPADSSEAIDDAGTADDSGDIDIPATAYYLIQTLVETIPGANLSSGDELGITIKRIALVDGSDPTADPVITCVGFLYVADKLGT